MTPNGKILKDAMAALKKPAKTRMPSNVSLPMFQNGGGLLSRSVTCSNCGHSWKSVEGGADPLDCHKCGGIVEMGKGGYVVSRSDDRKGKTHKVTGPDGTVKYFGDSKLGQHPKDPERKAAFYARHKKNLDGNPFFRAFARKTWADGGEISPYDMFDDGGESKGPGPKKPQPIYVDNPNDPRLQRYQDSLQLSSRKQKNPNSVISPAEFEKAHYKGAADNFKERGIKPIGFRDFSKTPYRTSEPVFAKPRQKVEYRKPASQQSVIQQPVRLPIPLMQDMAEPVFEDLSASPYRVDYSGGSKYFPSNVEGEAFMKQINTDFINNRGANPGNVSGYYNTKKFQRGGQHGGLDRWFAEKWVDVKSGKACGRQEGEKRAGYPACRPSRRVNDDTPKTSSELSSSEREKFKRSKTSSDRINYQHRRKEDGGEINETDMANKPNNPSLWSRAKSLARQKFDVYPSAYANGWAAKWYKGKGGTWRKAEYGMQLMGEGGINNPGFRALPPAVQQNIMDNMASGGEKMPPEIARARFAAAGNTDMLDDYGYAYGGYMPEMGFGGYHNTYMAGGGSTYSGNAFYGDGGMYPMYDEAGPVDPNGRFHGEWQDDPMLAEQFGYSQDMSEDEMLASQDAANVAAYPMKPTSIKVNTPKALPGKKGQGSGSIVDFLNSQGAKSDYATRKAIAEGVYGFGKYTGSADQNKRLLAIMKGDMGSTTEGSNQRSYNQNDGNMLRQGFDSSFDAQYPQFGSAQQGTFDSGVPRGNFDSFDSRYPQFGTNFSQNVPAQERIAPDQKRVSLVSGPGNFQQFPRYPEQTAPAQRPANFQYVQPGRSSAQNNFQQFPEYPERVATAPRSVSLKSGPGNFQQFPGYPKGLPSGPNREPFGPRPGVPLRGFSQFPMYAKGGYVEGQEMDVTPEQMERLRQQGYQFEII